jgi:RimJ/RimL family protein N-acetyltransferase
MRRWRIPELITDRLRLRDLRTGDEPFLAQLYSDPDVMRYISDGAASLVEAGEIAQTDVEIPSGRRLT